MKNTIMVMMISTNIAINNLRKMYVVTVFYLGDTLVQYITQPIPLPESRQIRFCFVPAGWLPGGWPSVNHPAGGLFIFSSADPSSHSVGSR
jgi:hypothetical protein